MFPIRDNVPSRRVPIVNYVIIWANLLVWLYELSLGDALGSAFYELGLVPAFQTDPRLVETLTAWDRARPWLTSMFVHGSWLHVIGNMWMLWIFGDNVEDYLGHARYVAFYVLVGLVAAAAQLLTSWGAVVPTVGASGAIAGVMGAYFILYPGAQVLTLVPMLVFIVPVALPAVVFIGLWFVLQFVSGTFSLLGGAGGGVAWWAHIGGFVGGVALVRTIGVGRRKVRVYEPWKTGRRIHDAAWRRRRIQDPDWWEP